MSTLSNGRLLIYCIENFRGITQSNVRAELNFMMLLRQQAFALENILDRLPDPLLDQRFRHVRYACAVSPELGQLVQIVPGCDGKGYRSAVGVSHE
jgi:hypothetical protein